MNETIYFEGKQSLGNRKALLVSRSFFIFIGFLMMVIPGLLMIGYYFLSAVTTKYKFTNTRLLIESGILSKKINALELWRINDIQFKQGMIQRLFGEGQLLLITQDKTNPIIQIEGIPMHDIRSLFEKLQPAINQSKKDNRAINLTA